MRDDDESGKVAGVSDEGMKENLADTLINDK